MKTINVVAAIDLTLLEHEDARWLAMEELDSVHWLHKRLLHSSIRSTI